MLESISNFAKGIYREVVARIVPNTLADRLHPDTFYWKCTAGPRCINKCVARELAGTFSDPDAYVPFDKGFTWDNHRFD